LHIEKLPSFWSPAHFFLPVSSPQLALLGEVFSLLQLTSAEVAAKDRAAVLLNAISKAAKTLFSRVPEAD
jgi:hypothetical protein